MEKIVIDTNILFSALHSPGKKTFKVLTGSPSCQFFCPNFLIAEIWEHKQELVDKAKVDEPLVTQYLLGVLPYVHFFNESLISVKNFFEAFHLVKDVDEDDIAFVALALELEARLWTRDTELKEGLLRKGFDRFFEP